MIDIQQKITEISEIGEIWKPCPEFENKYLISSHGRIMGIGSYNTCKKGELLKQHKKHGRNGYMQVRIYDSGRAKTFETHVLVARAFIPNPQNLPMVNHIDEDKTNNHVENLEWCTNQYNIAYSHSKAVDVYTKNGNFIETLNSISEAAIKYDTDTSGISACCKRKNGTLKGYQFRYKGDPFVPKPPVSSRTERRRLFGVKPREFYFVAIDDYLTNGTFIKTWINVSSASKEYGIPTTNISKCCKGQLKTTGGHIFLRHGDNIDNRLVSITNRKHKSKTEYELQRKHK